MDAPKTLASEVECTERSRLLTRTHVKDLARLVAGIRDAKGPGYKIPDFDPLDGGVNAEVLFLLEAPGRRAVTSGFVSRNNPDETARNFFLLSEEAGIDRRRTVTWNSVPWYIGSETKIRPARREDIVEANEWLKQLLAMLKRLRLVVLVGKKALHAIHIVSSSRPDVHVMAMPHPSPMFINRNPGNRIRILTALTEVSAQIASADA